MKRARQLPGSIGLGATLRPANVAPALSIAVIDTMQCVWCEPLREERFGLPAGSMYDAAPWAPDLQRGDDGICLVIVLPNGVHWYVDSKASNCKLEGPHRCWPRIGDPRTGHVTVPMVPSTCTPGAGSILAGSYHGFLDDGVLKRVP